MRTLLLIGALALTGCQDRGGEGTTVSIMGNAEDGNSHGASMDGASGKVKVDLPFFQGNFTLPKIQLDADDFDLNGVHLYPGSTIKGINVDARSNDERDLVVVSFDSPAAAATVRDYFRQRLAKADYKLTASGDGLTGTTDDDKPFKLSVKDAGASRSTGTITIG